MTSTQPMGRLSLVVMAIVTAAGVGCASGGFKVPAAEVQRLAQLPASERGRQVRVVPWDSDAAPAPAPESPAMEVSPVWNGDVYLDLSPPTHNRAQSWSGRAPTPSAPRPIASTGTFRGSPPGTSAPPARGSSGGWRGSPPPTSSAPSPSPAQFSTSSSPSRRGSSSGRKGGGSSADAGDGIIAVILAVVIVVGLVAIIAEAAADAEKESAYARSFDGWVRVDPDQIIHLRYHNGMNREVPLSSLTPADAAGVRYGYLRESDGPVVPLEEPWTFRDPPAVGPGGPERRSPPPPAAAGAPPAAPPPPPDDQWDG